MRSQRVALITGAAGGIGRCAVRRLASEGWGVAAVDRNGEGLLETAQGFSSVTTFCADVTEASTMETLVREVERGLGAVDRILCAAAVMPTGLLASQRTEAIRHVMEVNYLGTVHTVCPALPAMLRRQRGEILLFSSIAGWIPNLYFGAYSASKFAVSAFAEVLHHEVRARGIRVLCICPVKVATPLLERAKPRPRMLDLGPDPIQPEDVLDAAERSLVRGRVFCFGGSVGSLSWRMRRYAPGLLWHIGHRTEGLE